MPFPLDETARDLDLRNGGSAGGRATSPHISEGPPVVSGWDLKLGPATDDSEHNPERLEACAMGMGGSVVVGVGSKRTVWVWKERTDENRQYSLEPLE